MRHLSVSLALVTLSTLAVSCTGGRGADGTDGNNCTVNEKDGAAVIECGDGTTATITDGKTGPAGTNGTDGESGATGLDGANGFDSIVFLAGEPAGNNCQSGGTRVDAGLDANGNGVLDIEEVDATRYVCNGTNGTNGTDGADGADGADGTNGTNGTNGFTTLIDVTTEPIGTNCKAGGTRIKTGLDDNENGILDSSEVDQTRYLCQCVFVESKRLVPAIAYAALDYVGTQSWPDDNTLHVQSDDGSDVVSWLGFDLTDLPDNSIILEAKLFIHHNPAADAVTTDSPAVRALLGTIVPFTHESATTTLLPKGNVVVSPTTTTFAIDDWNELPLALPETISATARDENYLTIALDDPNNGTNTIAFYGSNTPETCPYVEVTLVSCETKL